MPGVESAKMGPAIERFYEAALQPELWRSVLHEFSEAMGADAAVILPSPGSRMVPVCSVALDETVETGVREGWFDRNPRMIRGMPAMRGPQDVLTEERLFRPDELSREPWYHDYAYRSGFGWFAGCLMVPDGQNPVVLSVERRRNKGLFEAADVQEFAKAIAHIQRAGQLAVRLAGAHVDGILDGLEALDCGGALLDMSGRTIRLNAKAERHVGNGLAVPHGRFGATDRTSDAALQSLIGSVLRPGPAHEAPAGGAVAVARMKGRPILVHAAPVAGSGHDLFQRASCILMIVDPDEHREPAEPVLRQLFRLTPAETRVALAMLRGQDVSEMAQGFGTSEGTVRTQLKALFAKTGTHRQSELMSLLSRLAIRSGPQQP